MLASAPSKYWLPPDISSEGYRIDNMINFLHYFMVVLFVVWGIFFVYCLFAFRQGAGRAVRYDPVKAKLSKYGELGVVIVETILLLLFSVPIWRAYKTEPPKPESDPLEVRVVAQQFAWNVHYPGADGVFGPSRPELVNEQSNPIGLDREDAEAKDDIVTLNQLHLPVNRPVVVRVTTKDVIHSFWIPMLRVKQDTIPGMEVPVWFTAEKTSAQVKLEMTRNYNLPDPSDARSLEHFLKVASTKEVMSAYSADDGTKILSSGDLLNEEGLQKLTDAGISEIALAPVNPIELHCAQLCGLNHYSMRGFVTVETEQEFEQYLKQQLEFMVPDEDTWGFE